jgi:beta-N-acetylhexosaminidase
VPLRSTRWAGLTALVIGLSAAAGLSLGRGGPPSQAARLAPERAAAPTRASAHPRAAATTRASGRPARGRSLAQLAGQRVIYAYAGLRPPTSLVGAIRAGEAAGVILFGPNISSRSQIKGVIAEFQRAALSSPLHAKLLILTDQEGGEVRRLAGAPTLSEKQIGESAGAVALAGAAGAGAGGNLAGLGINVNLAPVLDVYRAPGNFIDQYQRSYSSNPSTVARLGAAFISAQQRIGVAATGKHFPGLGAAGQSQNTDLRPVSLKLSLSTLRSVDEAPYRAAIAAGVKLVMTSWAVYPALDSQRPAGLSPEVIQGELRGRLGFRGVTITDGIDAGAVLPFGGLGRRSLLAARAGADLILCAATNPQDNTPQQGLTVLQAISSALAHGRLSRSAAQQAAARVLALREG